MTLETKRLALILGQLQLPAVVIGAFMFGLRGAPATAVMAASLALAVIASLAASILILSTNCPNCGGRYFSMFSLFFFTRRSCSRCGLSDDGDTISR